MIEEKIFHYARQIILIMGIAILAPLVTSQIADLTFPEPTSKEIIQAEAETEEHKAQNSIYTQMRTTARQNQFYIKAIGGLGLLLAGALCPIHTVGEGFLIGGIISLFATFINHWGQAKILQILFLLIAIAILVFASTRSRKE